MSGASAGDTSPVFTSVSANFDARNGPDIATVQVDGTLNVLFNNGHGSLSRTYSNSSATALSPVIAYIEAADLNSDGAPDIVAMDAGNSAFLVFLNKKDGTFADAVSTSVTPDSGASFLNGGSITVGDVNGDGKPDVIAVSNLQQGTFPDYTSIFSQQTFLGKGDGTFQAPQTKDTTITGFNFIQYGQGLGLADINQDGKSDLVIEIEEFDAKLATFLANSIGSGDGNFQPIRTAGARVEVDEPPQSTLKLADLNHDGAQDAVFITRDGAVYVALGKADGTFQSAKSVLSNLISAFLLGLGDFNKDGELDLLVYGYGVTGIFAGRGDGTFDPAARGQYVGSLGGDQQPDPVDLNNDGTLDFVWVEAVYSKVSVYLNKKAFFPAATAIVPTNNSPTYPNNTEWAYNNVIVGAGDFNADGKTDVLSFDFSNAAQTGFADIDFGISDSKGRFKYSVALDGKTIAGLKIVTVLPDTADFNNDGRSDLVITTEDGMLVALANADGTVQTPVPVTFPAKVGCTPVNYGALGDVNHDGFNDIVLAYAKNENCNISKDTPSGLFVFLGDGTGHFNGKFYTLGDELYFVKLSDFNGDGKLDAAVADLDGLNSVYNFYTVPGNGDGSFDTAAAKVAVNDELVSGIVTGDYNGDGKQDLTLLSAGKPDENGIPIPGTQGALLLPGNGDFTFGKPTLLAQGVYALTGAYGDFNHDGRLDLAIAQYSSFQDPIVNFGLIVMPNLGSGKFGPGSNYLLPVLNGVGNASVFVGDVNGDGAPDVIAGGGPSSGLFLNLR